MAKKPDPVDVHVGKRIRIFRVAKGLSQSALGDTLGVTYQQVQKYEKGMNRVGSSRLARLSKVLGMPVSRFFDEGADGAQGVSGEIVTDLLSKPHAIRMLRALANVPDNKIRVSLVALVESIAENGK